jgi:peptidoglycan/LPS O-acetylase OafA/YrhL
MEFILILINSVHFLFALAGAIISFYLWSKMGFKAPRYLHLLASVSGCIGMLLAYLGYASGAEHGEGAVWFVIGFPVATYLIFGFYGGGTIMAEKESNNEHKP